MPNYIIDLPLIRKIALSRGLRNKKAVSDATRELVDGGMPEPTAYNLFFSPKYLGAYEQGDPKGFQLNTVKLIAELLNTDPWEIVCQNHDAEGRLEVESILNPSYIKRGVEREDGRVNTLINPPSSFLGRQGDIRNVVELFLDRNARLVTISAPPCVGKTRVAIEAASKISKTTNWSIHWVDLVDATTEAGIAYAVLNKFPGAERVVSNQIETVQEAVGDFWKDKGNLLLILDNYEHIAQFAAKTIGVWLTNAPNLRILVTSRVLLNLGAYSERPVRLGPMEHANLKQCQTWDIEKILETTACKLFKERSEASGFGEFRFEELDDSDIRTIGRIVARCEGFPAPIELAAEQVPPMYSLCELENLLAREVFQTADFSRERRALHNAIEGILSGNFSESEKTGFFQLSNFTGGFTKEAFDAIINTKSSTLKDLWRKLIGYNLIRPAPTYLGKKMLMGFYLPIHEYARYKWEKIATVSLIEAHNKVFRTYFINEAQRLDRLIRSPQRPEILRQVNDIRENVLKIIDIDLAKGNACDALESLLSIRESLRVRGPAEVYLNYINKLYRFKTDFQPTQLATLMREHSVTLWGLGRFDEASKVIEEATAHVSPLGDNIIHAKCLETMSRIPKGKNTKGHHNLQLEQEFSARDIYMRLGDPRGHLLNGGFHLDWLGESKESIEAFEKTIEYAKQLGDPYELARYSSALGLVLWRDGQPEKACELFESAKLQFKRIEDENYVGGCLTNMGLALTDMGQNTEEAAMYHEKAQVCLEEGHSIFRRLNNKAWRSTNLVAQMRLLLRTKEFQKTRDFAEIHRTQILGSEFGENWTLFHVVEANACAALGSYSEALELLIPVNEHIEKVSEFYTLRSFSAQLATGISYFETGDKTTSAKAVRKAFKIAKKRQIVGDHPVLYLGEKMNQLADLALKVGVNTKLSK